MNDRYEKEGWGQTDDSLPTCYLPLFGRGRQSILKAEPLVPAWPFPGSMSKSPARNVVWKPTAALPLGPFGWQKRPLTELLKGERVHGAGVQRW